MAIKTVDIASIVFMSVAAVIVLALIGYLIVKRGLDLRKQRKLLQAQRLQSLQYEQYP
jgi:hypothetical protein